MPSLCPLSKQQGGPEEFVFRSSILLEDALVFRSGSFVATQLPLDFRNLHKSHVQFATRFQTAGYVGEIDNPESTLLSCGGTFPSDDTFALPTVLFSVSVTKNNASAIILRTALGADAVNEIHVSQASARLNSTGLMDGKNHTLAFLYEPAANSTNPARFNLYIDTNATVTVSDTRGSFFNYAGAQNVACFIGRPYAFGGYYAHQYPRARSADEMELLIDLISLSKVPQMNATELASLVGYLGEDTV